MKQPSRIMISGGGTAGTVAPLLALVEHFRKENIEAEWLFVGSDAGPERTLAESVNLPYRAIPSGKLRRYGSWQNIADIGQVWKGYRASQRLIKSWNPDLIISAGSYVSVPLIWAGKLAGVKTLIHQQDVLPGLANRLMARAAGVITVSFETSKKSFPERKTHYTGNPVRLDILHGKREEAIRLFQLKPNLPTLLVIGGSTGSQYINSMIGAVAYRLVQHWQIIHVTGFQKDFVELQDDRYHPVDFLTWEMPHVLAVADMVVCRTGLGTVTELAALGKPAMFIPLPDTHQEINAQLLKRYKAGQVVAQSDLSPNTFFDTLEYLRKNTTVRHQLGLNLHQLYRPDAAEKMTTLIMNLLQK